MSWAKAASITDVATGQVKAVTVAGKQLALCHAGDAFYAVDDLCTHDNGPLGEGELIGDMVECPRHGARFNVKTGDAVTLPAVVPVKTFPVKVTGEEILVQV